MIVNIRKRVNLSKKAKNECYNKGLNNQKRKGNNKKIKQKQNDFKYLYPFFFLLWKNLKIYIYILKEYY